jgi:glutamate N-acetyltransferase/amino-acid N-acetyltransferase
MPVHYAPALQTDVYPVSGICLGSTAAGIRKPGRLDLSVITLTAGSTVAGVFTRNRYCAAPVQVCRRHLQRRPDIRALVINTGIANAGTGQSGLIAAQASCNALASLCGIDPDQVLPFSTGVIMEPLPSERLCAALPQALADLSSDHWIRAAQAIMTTDTLHKVASRQVLIDGSPITVTGMAKGAGMICPNMATMLAFIATDAAISQDLLNRAVTDIADASFNRITVDGDTSTNDSFIVMATGQSAGQFSSADHPGWATIKAALCDVATELAQAIIRDGEGATKFIEIQVTGGQTRAECETVAHTIARSPLVKTAFFASDPNLGRILCAIGNAALHHPSLDNLDADRIKLWLGCATDEILVAEKGERASTYSETVAARIMQASQLTLRADLGRGNSSATTWTCDLSYDYVKINADYRS